MFIASRFIRCSRIPVNFFGTLNEGFHEAVGNNEKYGTHKLFEKYVGKRVMQSKLDLAGVFSEGYEPPVAIQVLEWAVQECHFDQFGGFSNIFGSETMLDMMIVDHNRCMGDRLILRDDR